MIIFREKHIAFVHIPKTAGTSIRNALIKSGGYDLRKIAKTKHETPEEYIANLFKRSAHPEIILPRFHFSRSLGDPVSKFSARLRFAIFVRDPLERFASLHRYLLLREKKNYPMIPEDLDLFVNCVVSGEEWTCPIRSIRPQKNYLPKRNSVWIGKYENLQSDFAELCGLLEIEGRLSHLNMTTKQRKAVDSFSPTSIERLKAFYRQDYLEFGYKY